MCCKFLESFRHVCSISIFLCLGFCPLHKTNKCRSHHFAKFGCDRCESIVPLRGSFTVSDNIVKNIGNFKDVVEASFFAIVDGDGKFDVIGGLACSCDESFKKSD